MTGRDQEVSLDTNLWPQTGQLVCVKLNGRRHQLLLIVIASHQTWGINILQKRRKTVAVNQKTYHFLGSYAIVQHVVQTTIRGCHSLQLPHPLSPFTGGLPHHLGRNLWAGPRPPIEEMLPAFSQWFLKVPSIAPRPSAVVQCMTWFCPDNMAATVWCHYWPLIGALPGHFSWCPACFVCRWCCWALSKHCMFLIGGLLKETETALNE